MGQMLAAEALLQELQTLTETMTVIRREVGNHVLPGEAQTDTNPLSTVAHSAEIVNQCKTAVDDLRHILWLYLEAGTSPQISGVDSRKRLLFRATEILCALSSRPPLLGSDGAASPSSLIERMLLLVENRINPQLLVKDHHTINCDGSGLEDPRLVLQRDFRD
jgi:hypothetical protein